MNFEKSFAERPVKDLEDGKYGSAVDFATGITKHYMQSIKLNAPTTFGPLIGAQIPATLPAPALLGAAAPVGPTIPISYKKAREKLFYNTVRSYFVAKELARGRVQVISLTRDVKSAINTYKKTTERLKELYDDIQTADDKLIALKEDLQNIKPELQKLIQSKKDILKQAREEFASLGQKFKQLSTQGLSNFDFETVMRQELDDLDFFLNFKVELSLNPIEFKQTFDTIANLLNRSSQTITKYQNVFSKEANLKLYLTKKIQTAVKEVLNLVNGFLSPEKFISLWKQLLYVPGGKRIGRIMLNIVNNNAKLKELKKKLLIRIEQTKKSVLAYLDRKIDTLIDKLKEAGDYVLDRLKIKKSLTKFRERLKSSKTLQNTIKRVKKAIQYIKRMIKHLQMVLDEVRVVITTVATVVQGIKDGVQAAKTVVTNIKDKYRDLQEDLVNSLSPEAQQARQDALEEFAENYTLKNLAQQQRPTEVLIGKIGGSTPIVKTLLNEIAKLLQLNDKQLAAFLRSKTNHAQNYINQIDKVLTVSIPRLQILLTTNPNASNYKQRIKEADELRKDETGKSGVKSVVDSKKRLPKSYLFLVEKCRSAGLKLQELENKLTTRITTETKKLANAAKDQDALIVYIDTLLDRKPKLKKIRNKKRKIDTDRAAIQAKVKKFKKIANQARIAFRLLDSSRTILQGINENRQTPISSNERAFKQLVTGFCDLQIDRGKMTKVQKKEKVARSNAKIADLKAYEVIYGFFIKILKEAKANNLADTIREELGEKFDTLDDKVKRYLQSILDMASGVVQNPSLKDIVNIPADIFNKINVGTAIVRAEQKAFRQLRGRVKNLSSFIPEATQDPVLIFVREKIDKVSSIVLLLLNVVAKFARAVSNFIGELMKPVIDFVKRTLSEEKNRITEEEIERQRQLIESKINLDGKIMSTMFGVAARLFWTGATWTNSAGTKFVVLNIGRFSPTMKALTVNGSQGYAEELAKGFNNQLAKMTGLAIPQISLGIVPFTWTGYVPLKSPPPTSAGPGSLDDFDTGGNLPATTFL